MAIMHSAFVEVIHRCMLYNSRYNEVDMFQPSISSGRVECLPTKEDCAVLRKLYKGEVYRIGANFVDFRDVARKEDRRAYTLMYEMMKLPKISPHAKFTALRLKGVI